MMMMMMMMMVMMMMMMMMMMMIYLLTAIGLSPGGRSTVHIYARTIHRTIRNKQYIEYMKSLPDITAVTKQQYIKCRRSVSLL